MSKEKQTKPWIKDLFIAFAATTLSIVLTFGTSVLINRNTQKKERRLTALMVMSNIETFARELEEAAETWDRMDSIAVWLLRMPIDDIALLGDEPFDDAIREVFQTPILRHDKTAETIFSSNINTWKNLGNFQFVDNVGACFSMMNWIEEAINNDSMEFRGHQARIYDNPPAYPGNTLTEKLLRDTQLRQQLLIPNSNKTWLTYCADNLRRMNRENMRLIGISEKEVLDFTDARGENAGEEEEEPDYSTFMKPFPDKDSIDTHLDYALRVDSLLRAIKK